MSLALHALLMFSIGVVAATIGSLAGLGGGFIAAPVLRIFFKLPPREAAATSLVLVFANVASASVAFLRQGRVDVRLAVTMGLLAIPGSIIGAFLVKIAPASAFDLLYAGLLGFVAIDLLRRRHAVAKGAVAKIPFGRLRVFHDRISGDDYEYTESPPIAAAAGISTGFLSSFFGLGGGIIVVPVLLRVFAMPAHIVSATSHMVILISAPFGVVAHALQGDIEWVDALPLAAGGVIGGQLGASVSRRLSGVVLVRFLAAILTAAAVSLVIEHLDVLYSLKH
jgi:uncharacterized membrane protein YfcA